MVKEDIEDLAKICPKSKISCAESCHKVSKMPIHLNCKDDQIEWHKIFDLQSLFDILTKSGDKPYMLVAGNTAHGTAPRCF